MSHIIYITYRPVGSRADATSKHDHLHTRATSCPLAGHTCFNTRPAQETERCRSTVGAFHGPALVSHPSTLAVSQLAGLRAGGAGVSWNVLELDAALEILQYGDDPAVVVGDPGVDGRDVLAAADAPRHQT